MKPLTASQRSKNNEKTIDNPRTLKARYVFPVAGEPVLDGTLTVAGERIVAVGKRPGGGPVEDLGNVAILPGLVNAHTHLEFSDLPKPLGTPGITLVDWIRLVIDEKGSRNRFSETVPGTFLPAVRRGLEESIRLGTTTLGEIAQPDWQAAHFDHAGLDATVFLELIAPTEDRIAPLLDLAPQHVRRQEPSACWRPGLSPHAPYSVVAELFSTAVSLSAAARVPLAFHLAESREELQLLSSGSGPFRDYFEQLGTCDPALFIAGRRPLDYLRTLCEAHRTLVIHGNYLDDEEISLLAQHADRMAVVHCPRTHAYFRHDPYPLEKMLDAGAVVALGTDSRASSPDLSVLAEMRLVAEKHPGIAPEIVLRLGTLDAARALGRAAEIGSLEPGKYANLAIVALPRRPAADPHELLFDSQRPVVSTWYRGQRENGTGPILAK